VPPAASLSRTLAPRFERLIAGKGTQDAGDLIEGLDPGGILGDHLEASGGDAGAGGEGEADFGPYRVFRRSLDQSPAQGPAAQIDGVGAGVLDLDELVDVLAEVQVWNVVGGLGGVGFPVKRRFLDRVVVDFTDDNLGRGRREQGKEQAAGGRKARPDWWR